MVKKKNCGIDTNAISVVRLEGPGDVFVDFVPNLEDPINGDPVEALCFNVQIVRVETEQVIGTAKDCLNLNIDNEVCGTFSGTATTTYNLDCGDSITSRVKVTAQPTASGSSLDFTHINGAIPSSSDTNLILSG
eukprot:312786_1